MGASQRVEVLQREEGVGRIGPARGDVGGDVVPAVAGVDAGKLQPGEEGDGPDLVLRIGLGDAPDVAVIAAQRIVGAAARDVEQCEVPPVVGAHEAVQVRPGGGDAFEEGYAFVGAGLGQHDMGKSVVRPGV